MTNVQKAGPGRLIRNAEAAPERLSEMGRMKQQRVQATRALKRQQALSLPGGP